MGTPKVPNVIITGKEQINKLCNWIDGNVCKALDGGPVEVVLRRPEQPKSDVQREKFHAMIGDINKTGVIKIPGKIIDLSLFDFDECKSLLVIWFANDKASMNEPLPRPPRTIQDPFNGKDITVRPSTKEWGKKLTSEFVEFLYYTGSISGTKWSEPALKEYEQYREAQK